jgi:hypothetical protein
MHSNEWLGPRLNMYSHSWRQLDSNGCQNKNLSRLHLPRCYNFQIKKVHMPDGSLRAACTQGGLVRIASKRQSL